MRTITPADVMDLRGSIRWRVANGTVPLEPHIIYLPADNAFLLRAYGRPMAQSPDLMLLGQCLVCERAEPGFIQRILSTDEPCDIASLSPDLRRAEQARRAEEAAKQRAAEAEKARLLIEASKRLRNVPPEDISSLSLDDF